MASPSLTSTFPAAAPTQQDFPRIACCACFPLHTHFLVVPGRRPYHTWHNGEMSDYIPTDAELEESFAKLP